MGIAVYVTTQVRLQRYEYLSELGQSSLYCDTDSVIYIQKGDESTKVKTWDYMGKIADELQDFVSGSYIEEFVSSGPKNYAFSVFCLPAGKRATKCKI